MVQVKRFPRKWLVVWTHSGNDVQVAAKLRELMSEHQCLLEVFLPLVSVRKVVNKKTVVASEPAAQGYIFLRVANADFDLVEAVREVKGVGGFLSPDVSSALDGIPQADVTRMLNMHNRSVDNVVTLRVDDEVEIVSGPLMHHTGRVAEITTDVITVSVSILGRLVDMAFSPVEVKSLK